MSEKTSKFGSIGMICGGLALLLALAHFYGGPFSPQSTFETSIADKAVEIRDATVAALRGEETSKKTLMADMDLDRITQLVTSLLGGLAVILGAVSFARKESTRVAVSAVALGTFAIGFQFVGVALGALLFVIVLAAVLSTLGLG